MTIEDVLKTCKPILATRTKAGDSRCFFEDEENKIVYVFGPSSYIRQGFPKKNQEYIEVLEFENGPYIGLGDEVLSGKFATGLGITYDHGIPLVTINYANEPKKTKRKKKNK